MTTPYSIFPLELLQRELTGTELKVLIAIYALCGPDNKTASPSIDELAECAGVNDRTRVSKITTSLAKKGCLTKVKNGFTGTNEYTLLLPVPVIDAAALPAAQSANLDETTKLVKPPKLAKKPKLVKAAKLVKKTTLDKPAKLEQSARPKPSANANLDELTNLVETANLDTMANLEKHANLDRDTELDELAKLAESTLDMFDEITQS